MLVSDDINYRLSKMLFGQEPQPWKRFFSEHKDGFIMGQKYSDGLYLFLSGKEHRSMHVKPSKEVTKWVNEHVYNPNNVYFEVVERDDGSMLLIARQSGIISSKWVGFIDPATVPTRE